MFSAMVLDLDSTTIPHGSAHEVRTWAATGAILFVLLVLLCTGCSLGLRFTSKLIILRYDAGDLYVRYGLALLSFLFQGLLLAGTLFFCLVVKAYVPVVGWVAFGITSVCLLLSLVFWILQLCKEVNERHQKVESQPVRREPDC